MLITHIHMWFEILDFIVVYFKLSGLILQIKGKAKNG